MLLGARVHAMLLYIVIYLSVFSVLIPLSAYVGRCTFHIYMHSVFDISIRWSASNSSAQIFPLVHLMFDIGICCLAPVYMPCFCILSYTSWCSRCCFHSRHMF